MTDVVPTGLSAGVIMAQLSQASLQRQYVGTLADSDAKSLVTRSYNTTKEEAAAVDRVVGSPVTLYISHGDFVRHAVWELLQAYEEAGFPDTFLPDMTHHLRSMREGALQVRLRQEFQDVLLVYETGLSDGMETGDFDFITATLRTLEGYIERTPDPHWKTYLKRTILRSGVIKAAVDSFYEWSTDNSNAGKVPLEYQAQAERWALWLEGLAE